jgi:hypothetical protein
VGAQLNQLEGERATINAIHQVMQLISLVEITITTE